jgi:hypothetical protein
MPLIGLQPRRFFVFSCTYLIANFVDVAGVTIASAASTFCLAGCTYGRDGYAAGRKVQWRLPDLPLAVRFFIVHYPVFFYGCLPSFLPPLFFRLFYGLTASIGG